MMRCDNCMHWRLVESDWQADRAGFKLCAAILEQWKITEVATADIAYPSRPESEPLLGDIPPERQAALDAYMEIQDNALREAKAYVIDGSQYMAQLWTGPDFFCAKFAARGIPTEGGDACGSVHG